MAVSALHFPSKQRGHMSLEARACENRGWQARLREPRERDRIVQMAWRSIGGRAWRIEREYLRLAESHASALDDLNRTLAAYRRLEATLGAVLRSTSWRLTAPLRAGLSVARRLALAHRRRGRP